MNIVNGIDLDLLLEDLAYTKRRVAELEDNQEIIIKFMRARFPKHGNQLKKLLHNPEGHKSKSKPNNSYSSFGQEDNVLSIGNAIKQHFSAKNVSVDPILKNVGIVGTREKPAIPESLRG
ncbi:MAG: hypothetical protein ABFD07_01525 [Methanobacterium sp.]